MRKYISVALLLSLGFINGCGIGQNVVGKWDCKTDGVTYKDGDKNTYEYLADGTQIVKLEYSSNDLKTSNLTGTWEAIDNSRFTSTFDGKSNVRQYKFEGDKLLFKSSSSDEYSVKCDRAK